MSNIVSLPDAVRLLQNGQVIAYPTESIYGLGCDPDNEDAIQVLLKLKQRSVKKGVILIADNYNQLRPYIDETPLTNIRKHEIMATWPGPITWLFPKNKTTLYYLTGQHDTLAVRVSAHPVVKALCQQYGKPIVSTSANISGNAPCRSVNELTTYFGDHLPIVGGNLGSNPQPSQIRDSLTGKIIRY